MLLIVTGCKGVALPLNEVMRLRVISLLTQCRLLILPPFLRNNVPAGRGRVAAIPCFLQGDAALLARRGRMFPAINSSDCSCHAPARDVER